MLRRLVSAVFIVFAALGVAGTSAADAVPADTVTAASRFIPGVPIFRDDPRPVIFIAIADTLVNPYDILSLRQTIRKLSDLLPEYRLHTITITAAEAAESLTAAKPHFLFAPAGFVAVASREYRLSLSRIATRKTAAADTAEHSVGAVFVVRKESTIETLADMQGKSAATGLPTAIDGWLAALGEIQAAGFDETRFFGHVDFRNNAYPDVVSSLLSGKTHVGILPACLLESLEARKLADTADLRVINAKEEGLRCRHSTALYPDLSLLALSYAPEDMVRDMTIAILRLRDDGNLSWLTNVSHGDVLELLQNLAVGPFSYLRESSFTAFLNHYRTEILFAAILLVLLILNEIRLHRLVRRRTDALKRSMAEQNRIKEEAAQSRLQLAVFERRNLVQQMSGMIAHEINAPVGAIRSYAAVLKMQTADGRRPDTGLIDKVLTAVDKEATRISAIIARVRTYARNSMPEQAPCDLVLILERSIRALTAERSEKDRPRIVMNEVVKTAPVMGNALELEILFLNLLRNAANALAKENRPTGLITCAVFAAPDIRRWKVVITNHGNPVDQDVITQLNNKSAAVEASPSAYGGMGLGLTICRGIADSHGASLRFEHPAEGSVSALRRRRHQGDLCIMTINLPLIRLVDDDDDYRASQSFLLSSLGWELKDWADPGEFLAQDDTKRPGCLVLDLRMPGMTGLEVQQALENRGSTLPIIFLTGHGDVTTAVRTLTHGAVDFIEKDSDPMRLVEAVKKAVAASACEFQKTTEKESKRQLFATLTPREQEILRLAAKGLANKDIADQLSIGVVTVKMHRGNAFAKIGAQGALQAYKWLEAAGLTEPAA